jgi:hypothetical protein
VVKVFFFDENSTLFGLISSCQFFWIMLPSFRFPTTIQSWWAIWKIAKAPDGA